MDKISERMHKKLVELIEDSERLLEKYESSKLRQEAHDVQLEHKKKLEVSIIKARRCIYDYAKIQYVILINVSETRHIIGKVLILISTIKLNLIDLFSTNKSDLEVIQILDNRLIKILEFKSVSREKLNSISGLASNTIKDIKTPDATPDVKTAITKIIRLFKKVASDPFIEINIFIDLINRHTSVSRKFYNCDWKDDIIDELHASLGINENIDRVAPVDELHASLGINENIDRVAPVDELHASLGINENIDRVAPVDELHASLGTSEGIDETIKDLE
jgi:hypothetical protein